MQRCATKSGGCVGAFATLQTSEKLILKMIWMMNQVKAKWMCTVITCRPLTTASTKSLDRVRGSTMTLKPNTIAFGSSSIITREA